MSEEDYKFHVAMITDGEIKQHKEIKFNKDDDYIVIPLKNNKQRRAKEKRKVRKMWEDFESEER